MLIIGQLSLHQLPSPRLSIIGEVEEMDEIRFLFLYSVPAKVDDVFEAEDRVILFPAFALENRVRFREWNELEFYTGLRVSKRKNRYDG